MTRSRVRQHLSVQELNDLYHVAWWFDEHQDYSNHPHLKNCPNVMWGIEMRIAFGMQFGPITSLADLSCGDGKIPRAVAAARGVEPVLGDLGEGWGYDIRGPLSETVPKLDVVDLYICSETIEHLDDPDSDLRLIRDHCVNLMVTTPVDEAEPAPGHYWSWSRADVEEMLVKAGFMISAYVEMDFTPLWYPVTKFGMWACR